MPRGAQEVTMKPGLLALLVSPFLVPQPASTPLPFSDGRWELRGDRTAVATHDGRTTLQIETGSAHRPDVRLRDGTIDFDVQLTPRRSFVYVYFRVTGEGEREEFYLRPHKSGLPDAAQYAPVWQGRSAWQLHHGPGGTAAVTFAPGAWTHVRVVVQGVHAALFVGDMRTPALLVPRLSRQPAEGSIAVSGFLPQGVPGEGPIARFANVVVRPGVVEFDLPSAVAAAAAQSPAAATDGVVRAWAVSRAFVPGSSALAELPDAGQAGEYQRIEAEPGGLIQLHRHIRMPEQSNVAAAVARLRVRAAAAGTYVFDLGYSDIATVFVNGRPIFRGDGSYSFDRPRREGLIGFDNARLYLPLAAGENDLAVLVSDSFGGWGLMGRFTGAAGVTAEPYCR
jgi:hypothetical protein